MRTVFNRVTFTHMPNAADIETRARRMVATKTVDQLVELYGLTDRQMDDLAGRTDDDARLEVAALVTTRGWIMDELDTRGEAGNAALLAICGIEEW